MIPWFQAFVFKCNLYRYSMGLVDEAAAARAALRPVEVSADVAKALPALTADGAAVEVAK